MITINVKQKIGVLDLQVDTLLPDQGISAIFGVSGSGKTTLINLISGLNTPDSGEIILNGRVLFNEQQKINLAVEKRKIGYVFQDARLFPHYSVVGNLRYGMAKSMQKEFDNIIQLLGIEQLLKRQPTTLSGGEKQRVAIGRALLTAPELLLMDEPLASLDLLRKKELMPYLEQLAYQVNIPIIYVSHSIDEILRLADHLLVINQGKIIASGELEQVWSSQILQPWLADYEYCNILALNFSHYHANYPISALHIDQQLLWINEKLPITNKKLHVKIKANDISLTRQKPEHSSIRNILTAQIIGHQSTDHGVMIKLQIGNHIIWSQITSWAFDELRPQCGQNIFIQIKSVSVS